MGELLRAIGRLVVNFNAADHSLRMLAWHLVDPKDRRAAQIILDGMETSKIEELIRALLPHRIADKETGDKGLALITRMSEVRSRRRQLVHSFWRLPNESSDVADLQAVLPARRKSDYDIVYRTPDPTQIAPTADAASDLAHQLEDYLKEIASAPVPPPPIDDEVQESNENGSQVT
jgi:hypothetical protein